MKAIDCKNGRVALNTAMLKQLRGYRGWTQGKLAELCLDKGMPVSVASIKRAESGNKVLFRVANNLASIFEVSIHDLACTGNDCDSKPKLRGLDKALGNLVELHVECRYAGDIERIKVLFDDDKYSYKNRGNNFLVLANSKVCFGDETYVLSQLWGDIKNKIKTDIRAALHLSIRRLSEETWTVDEFLPSVCEWGEIVSCQNMLSSGYCLPEVSAVLPLGKRERWVPITTEYVLGRCIGRDIELACLHNIYSQVSEGHAGEVVCVHGAAGIGKTRIILEFQRQLKARHDGRLLDEPFSNSIVSVNGVQKSPIRDLTLQLLGLSDGDDAHLREGLAHCGYKNISHVACLTLLGVNLLKTEKVLFISQTASVQQDLLYATLRSIIKNRCVRGPVVMNIDDVHLGAPSFIEMIKNLQCDVNEFPLMLILGVRNVGAYTSIPDWLGGAMKINVRPLNKRHVRQIACDIQPFIRSESFVESAVDNAVGHPRMLLQYLFNPFQSIPNFILGMMENIISNLDKVYQLAVKVAAVIEESFCERKINYCVRNIHQDTNDVHIYRLVVQGVFKFESNNFCFQHPVLKQAALRLVSEFEKRRIVSLCVDWAEENNAIKQRDFLIN